ncbi:McrB family protein [Shewanella metallivivens]|uniref:AAA family ATPase n=1 Tax=Shewanella metallivivens TaxID=2872342 RepID=A0ABT5TIT4_9GAMM|nr:AAA family ATPase [Shewanella metallivivens]MDD8058506.1 AAA family ATPase [Shewanella metallivivens]
MLNSEQIHEILLRLIGTNDKHNHPSYAHEHCLYKDSYIYVKHKPDLIVKKQPLVLHPSIIHLKGEVDAIEGVETDWQPTKNTSFRRYPKLNGTSQYGYAFNVESEGAIQQLLYLIGISNGHPEMNKTKQSTKAGGNMAALNQILYGPPGTGKTYNTINQALAIVDPAYLTEYEHDRHKIKARFDELVTKNRIGFVTFHQSFSYEDFVEGLKANSDNGVLSYSVDPGVFKSICERASSSHLQVVSVDAFDDAVIQLQEKYEEADDRIEMETVRGKKFEIEYVGGITFKIFPHSTESTDPKYVASIANVRKLYLTGSKQDIYNTSYVEGFLLYLKKHFGLKEYVPEVADHETTQQPFVLIIDEINRGNISNIFGELITLIEPSKRSGCAEALSVKLPYSKESFSVPSNLHIIGTMNTADKSLAQVDIALRRRFEFVEMMPQHGLLSGIAIDGIDVAKMLKTINQRIELLYDREHTIGHSFFLPLKDDPSIERLARIFELEILPLLEEYFFEDWERVGQVLGDHLKTDASLQFIEEKFTDSSVLQLMGNDWSQDGIRPYQRNDAALSNPDAYKGIYDAQQG